MEGMMATDTVQRLRQLLAEAGMSHSGLARAAALPSSCLRGMESNDWVPSPDILAKLETYLAKREEGTALATPEEIINEARNGRMFILVDDEDRENEGDLVIPAQMATPDAINYMARHGRGLICLALAQARVDALGL